MQTEVPLSSLGSVTEQGNVGSASLGISPHEKAFCVVTFAETVRECVEDDAMSSVSEQGVVSEGHCNVLRLSYQLYPAAAPEHPPALHSVCNFEGLFASVGRPTAVEGAPTLFHRVAELRAEHRQALPCGCGGWQVTVVSLAVSSSRPWLLFGPFACGCSTCQHGDSPACWFAVQ